VAAASMAARLSTVAAAAVAARLSTLVDAIVTDTPPAAVTLRVSPVVLQQLLQCLLECLLWGLLRCHGGCNRVYHCGCHSG
jgi:hypothetical protein